MLHPIEVARQLTVIESELFRAMEPSELLGLAWTKTGKEVRSRHVLQLIYRFNVVSNWIIRSILEAKHLEERVDVLLHFLEVLREMSTLNNINGMMEVISALNSSMIERLKYTWNEIPSKRQKVFDDAVAQLTTGKNYKGIRSMVAKSACRHYAPRIRKRGANHDEI